MQTVEILQTCVLTELLHTVINQLLFLLFIRDGLRLQVTCLLKHMQINNDKSHANNNTGIMFLCNFPVPVDSIIRSIITFYTLAKALGQVLKLLSPNKQKEKSIVCKGV